MAALLRLHHYLCRLYDAAAAGPVRPLTERRRRVLAEVRKLANTALREARDRIRAAILDSRLCATCEPLAELGWYEKQERRQRGRRGSRPADRR
jgi:hypothetical protein